MFKIEPLISIIVPVYNVERYISRCIESLINQTYINIEIILVDDGSTDNSYNICEKYAKEDLRVKLFHKKNGGVSSARNIGLKNAKGEYITFVDSDDWVKDDMIEHLLKKLNDNNVDISICTCIVATNESMWDPNEGREDCLITEKEAIKRLLYKEYCVVWGTLFSRNVIEGIFFREDISNNEDSYFLFNVFRKAKKIYKSCQAKYIYNRQQEASITKNKNKKKALDQLKVANLIGNDLKSQLNEYEKEYSFYKFCALYNLNRDFIDMNIFDDPIIKENRIELKKYYKKIIFNSEVKTKLKMKTILLIICPKVFKKIKDRS